MFEVRGGLRCDCLWKSAERFRGSRNVRCRKEETEDYRICFYFCMRSKYMRKFVVEAAWRFPSNLDSLWFTAGSLSANQQLKNWRSVSADSCREPSVSSRSFGVFVLLSHAEMCSLDLDVNPSLSLFLWMKWGQIFWRERTAVERFD